MADIKQAAIWMQEGKHVRRANRSLISPLGMKCAPSLFLGADGLARGMTHGGKVCFFITSLLADDWEIVPKEAVDGE